MLQLMHSLKSARPLFQLLGRSLSSLFVTDKHFSCPEVLLSVAVLLSYSLLPSQVINTFQCSTKGNKRFRCEVMLENDHTFCSWMNHVRTRIAFRQLMRTASYSKYDLKMTVFWDVSPFSLAEMDRRFRGSYYLDHQCRNYGGRKHLWPIIHR
jgi:hypothetical protein